MTTAKTTKSHCNQCGHDTKHYVLADRQHRGSQEIGGARRDHRHTIDWTNTYVLLECCGCEEISVRRTSWFSEDPEDEDVGYFPPRVSRRQPEWINELSDETPQLLREIYGALHQDHKRLALMGARAVIDGLMLRQVGDVGTFVSKLDELEKMGFLSQVNRSVLETALNAGHAAVHRGFEPSAEVLSRVMDIVENVLQAEILAGELDQLKTAIPGRPSS